MIVMTVNSGSTSVKLAAYEVPGVSRPIRIAHEQFAGVVPSVQDALKAFLKSLPRKPEVVAHRVVHGGTRFTGPARLEASVLAEIRKLSELAPLHNPKALQWIEASQALCGPDVTQLAAFDTSFFAAMPRVAGEYALAARFGVAEGVRRYGFHGLAHEAMWRSWQESSQLPDGGRLITLQLGGGCSIAAIAAGRPLDTSMGFSPLEGLVMETRSGDIDAAIVPYLQRRLAKSSEEIVELLNTEAGLAGLSGTDGDINALLLDGAKQSRFAVDLYCYRARKYLGAYLAILGGCDGIVFGGGVGEHIPDVRAQILSGMQWAGIELDPRANEAARGVAARISAPESRIAIHVIPVDEEQILISAAQAIMSAK